MHHWFRYNIPMYIWLIFEFTEAEYKEGYAIPFDYESIPNKRVQFFQGKE